MHKTVLLNEAIDNLNVKKDGIYVAATPVSYTHLGE